MFDDKYKGRTVFNAAPQLDYEAVSWEQPTQAEVDVFRRAIEAHKQAHRDRINKLLDDKRIRNPKHKGDGDGLLQ